jgi:signal transduction histidine kinase
MPAKIIEEAAALALIGAKGSGVKVRLHSAPRLAEVVIDRVQFQQIVVNLMKNAIEVMEVSHRRELTISAATIEDASVRISVVDIGPGISPGLADRLFQPFVTTKGAGDGCWAIDLPVDRQGSQRQALGRGQPRRRHDLPLHRSVNPLAPRHLASRMLRLF